MSSKITLKYKDNNSDVTITCRNTSTSYDFLEQVYSFMLAAGWGEDSIRYAFIEKAEELDNTVDGRLEEDGETWEEFLEKEGHEIFKSDWGLKQGESCFYNIDTSSNSEIPTSSDEKVRQGIEDAKKGDLYDLGSFKDEEEE